MKYREEKTLSGATIIVRTNDDGSETWIPKEEANSDYQEYLAHLTESVTKAK